MSGTYEKLGIELTIEGDLQKQLTNALSKLDISSITKRLKEVEDKIQGTFRIRDDVLDGVAKKLGLGLEEAKKKIEQTRIGALVEKEIKAMQKPWADYVAQVNKETKAYEQRMEQHTRFVGEQARERKKIVDQEAAAWTQRNKETGTGGTGNKTSDIDKAYAQKAQQEQKALKEQLLIRQQERKMWQEHEQAAEKRVSKLNALAQKELEIAAKKEQAAQKELDAILKKIDAEKRADKLSEQQAAQATMGAYRNAGMKPWNDGRVRITAIEDVDLAHSKALEERARRVAAAERERARAHREAELAARKGEQANNLLTASFSRMAGRLAEFYSIRTVLFAVTGQVRDAVQGLLDFNQALHDTAAISNASNQHLTAMADAAIGIAKSSRFTTAEIAAAMKTIAQAGVSAGDVPEVARVSNMFAVGSGATMAQSVDLITTALNVWKASAKDSAQIANIWTAALNESKLEAGQLGTILNYLGNQSALAGKSLEETAGIVAVFANQGVKASTIGTSVSLLMTRLMAPTPKFKKLLDEFGISLDQVNPKVHSFAEVIRVFEGKNIPVERLLSSLEQRAGRALATAIQAGADAFENMSTRMQGTAASALAYSKAMEGARAKMNVLKQEFTELISISGSVFSGAIEAGYQALLRLVQGLKTAEGSLIVLAGAITVVGLAMETVLNGIIKHPVGAALAAIGVSIMGLVAVIGKLKGAYKDSLAGFSKDLSDQASAVQRQKSAFSELDVEVRKYNKNLKDSKNPKEQVVALTGTMKDKIRELAKEYKEFLPLLFKEKTTYGEILAIKDRLAAQDYYNAQLNVGKYNQKMNRFNELENQLFGKPLHGQTVDTRKVTYTSPYLKERDKAEYEGLKKEVEVIRQLMDSNPYLEKNFFSNSYRLLDKPKTFGNITAPGGEDVEGDSSSSTIDDKRKKAIEKYKENLRKWQDEVTQLKEKSEMDTLKVQMDLTEKTLKDENADYSEKLKAYFKLKEEWTKYYQAEYNKEVAKAKADSLKDFGVQGLDDENAQKLLKDKIAILDKERADKTKGKLASFGSASELLPTPTLPASSDKFIKSYDKELASRKQALELQKESAWTEEQVNELARQQVALETEISQKKVAAWEAEAKSLEAWVANTDITEANKQKFADLGTLHDALIDKIEAENGLIEEQKQKYERMDEGDFFSNFSQGLRQGSVALGSFKSSTIELGSTLTTTLSDGLQGTMNGMIDALGRGENAWKSFRTGMGQMLKDIGNMLQKYVVQMLVVYAVQKMIGFAASSMTTVSDQVPTELGGWGNQINDAQWGGAGVGWAAGMAEGGLLTGGIPGKDSIPILAMPGEYVLPKWLVDQIGVGNLERMRAGKVQGFVEGGAVGGAGGFSRMEEPKKEREITLNLINLVDPSQIPRTTDTEILNVIQIDAMKNGPTFRSLKAKLQGL